MPPTLGQRLKHAREKRGLTLRDIEHTSKIPVARLQDLEDDKLNSFGGMTYAKAFLRTYADFLGVNADEVLSQIQPPPLGGVRDYRYLVESHGTWVTEKTHRQYRPVSHEHSTAAASTSTTFAEGKSFLFAALVCIAFALLIGGGVLANAYFGSKQKATGSSHGTEASGAMGAQVTTDEYEFSLFGANITIVPDQVIDLVHPVPRAIPVPESMGIAPGSPKAESVNSNLAPPKAEAVR